MKNRFSWAVKPITRRRSVPRALMFGNPISTKAVTLPPVTLRDVTDSDCGLPNDPVAQQRAEEYIAAAISYRIKMEAKQIDPVCVTVSDESLEIVDENCPTVQGIAFELRRICGLVSTSSGS